MVIKELINSNFNEFISLCQQYNAKTTYAFGSFTTLNFNQNEMTRKQNY